MEDAGVMASGTNGGAGMDGATGRSGGGKVSIAIVSAGLGDPSSTTRLARQVGRAAVKRLHEKGVDASAVLVDLRGLSQDVAVAQVSRSVSEPLRRAIEAVASSDAVIAASPVIKASYSGLFKGFWDIVEPDVMLAMPTAVVATSGSPRHALVADTDMRSLFAFLRAVVAPTSVVASGSDWSDPGLSDRTAREGGELAAMILSGLRRSIMDLAGKTYRRSFATPTLGDDVAERTQGGLDFDSRLMRLAAGGVLPTLDETDGSDV